MNISKLQKELRAFAKARDWEQFHTPKNLTMALSGEVGELSEIFQWLTTQESKSLNAETRMHVGQELADIAIYTFRLFDILEIDPSEAIQNKLEINEKKYPIDVSKGNATKYTKRKD